MKNIKIGCDIVALPRFKKILSRTPAMRRRIFSPLEERGATIERLAGIFAAKEATLKALGIAAGRWRDIEILYRKSGKPKVNLSKNFSHYGMSDLSISHDGKYVIAFVIFYGDS